MRCSNFCLKAVLASSGVQPASIASSMVYSHVYQVSRSVVARGRSVTSLSVNIGILLPWWREMRRGAKNGKSLHGREHASDTRPFQVRKETKCRDAKAVSDPFIV